MSTSGALPVTVVVSRRPRQGHEDDLARWAAGIGASAARFPGHLGAQIFPPDPPDRPDLVIVFSFAAAAQLARWEASPQRADWLTRAEPLVEGPTRTHAVTGFEALFRSLTDAGQGVPPTPPPRWKTAVLIGLALYPLSLLVAWLLGPLLGSLVLPLRSLVSAAILVPAMTWVAVPTLSRWLHGWLHPARRPSTDG